MESTVLTLRVNTKTKQAQVSVEAMNQAIRKRMAGASKSEGRRPRLRAARLIQAVLVSARTGKADLSDLFISHAAQLADARPPSPLTRLQLDFRV